MLCIGGNTSSQWKSVFELDGDESFPFYFSYLFIFCVLLPEEWKQEKSTSLWYTHFKGRAGERTELLQNSKWFRSWDSYTSSSILFSDVVSTKKWVKMEAMMMIGDEEDSWWRRTSPQSCNWGRKGVFEVQTCTNWAFCRRLHWIEK